MPFLGLTIQRSPSGLFLHQVQYAELLLEEHASHIPKRARTTTGEAESFKEEQNPSQPPDQGNPEHLEWIKIGQRIIGALLWLSTRTRPDLSCAVSLASQSLFKDLKKLKDRLRHLLQYLKSTKNLGLSYPFPKGTSNKFSLTEFTVYTDSSFAPAGKQSQTGIALFLTYGTVRHLIHWQSSKEKKMAESSAESELYALSAGHKVGRNFSRVRKISPKWFSKSGTSRKSQDIPATPCLKQQKKATCIKILSGISRRLGPGCPRKVLKEYPAQKR